MPAADRAQYERMTQTPIPKLITKLSIPTVASMLVTALYNTADTFYVSHLGKSATAAVGVTYVAGTTVINGVSGRRNWGPMPY